MHVVCMWCARGVHVMCMWCACGVHVYLTGSWHGMNEKLHLLAAINTHTQLKYCCNDDHGKMEAMLPDMLEAHNVPSLVFTPVYNPRYARHVILM